MKPWHTVALLIGWMLLLTLVGRATVRLFSFRTRPFACFYLAPVLGLAAYMLLATLIGWTVGMHSGVVVPLSLCLAAVAAYVERNSRGLTRHLASVIAASLVSAGGILILLWHFGGYNVFNDTFTYLVHGQWLQTHAFRVAAGPTLWEPAYTQVAVYQALGFRMGASFFLAWVQAASPFEWSIQVYPSVAIIALSCGSLAVAGLTFALVGRRWLSFGWGMVAGSGIGGFAYGGTTGFLPQLFGLTFATAFIVFLVRLRVRSSRWAESLRQMAPLAFLFAAVGYSYSELLPLAGISVTAWFAWTFIFSGQHRRALVQAGFTFLACVAFLLNIEFIRIFRALRIQGNAVVGWPVPWSLFEFIAHSAGLHSGSGDGDQWLVAGQTFGAFALAAAAACLASGWTRVARRDAKISRWIAPVAYLGLCFAGMLFFRFGHASPWPVGVGQTWNQFKLSNWSSPVLIAIIGAGLIAATAARAMIAWAVIAVLVALNLNAHRCLLADRTRESIRLSGRSFDPFRTYLDLRRLAMTAHPYGVTFLDLGNSEHKSRQLMSYFLHDAKVSADWTNDGYIYPWLPPGWQSLSVTNSKWLIRRATEDGAAPADTVVFRSGSLVFGPTPEFFVSRQSVNGGHGVESDESGWWVWASQRLSVRLQVHTKLPARVRLTFTCIVAAEPRILAITHRLRTQPDSTVRKEFSGGWQTYTSDPFQISDSEIEVEISCDSPPNPIAATDLRLVTFLVKNIRLEPEGLIE